MLGAVLTPEGISCAQHSYRNNVYAALATVSRLPNTNDIRQKRRRRDATTVITHELAFKRQKISPCSAYLVMA